MTSGSEQYLGGFGALFLHLWIAATLDVPKAPVKHIDAKIMFHVTLFAWYVGRMNECGSKEYIPECWNHWVI